MTTKQSKMTRINISVPEELLEKFKKYCETECRPVSAQLQYMMKKTLEEKELASQQPTTKSEYRL